MTYEVVVVGAGLGGLTAAALLSARGVSVCVVEKESRGGGCAASFEKFGYSFEPTAGLYTSWGEGEIHARVFAQLPVAPPGARRVDPAYVVRLHDGAEVRVGAKDADEFDAVLRAAFPECAAFAADFYRELQQLADAQSSLTLTSRPRARTRLFQRWKPGAHGDTKDTTRFNKDATRFDAAQRETVAQHLVAASPRFRRFIDAQLQLFASCASDECSYAYAASALTLPRRGMYALTGGVRSLADALVESIRRSGGTIRFDTTALRLAYDSTGAAVGVDLLSGETLRATRAVVSNLTVWDTYGKLVGLNRTPARERARLKSLRGWGAYLVFLGLDEQPASRLMCERLLALADFEDGEDFDPARSAFTLNVAPAWDARAPTGRRAATLATFADASEWFAYHEDESEHEAQDERALASCWERLHAALPGLCDNAEVIETLTPRGYYEQTRRALGKVWGVARTARADGSDAHARLTSNEGARSPNDASAHADANAHALNDASGNVFNHRTHLPNLFMVGDTVAAGNNVAAVTQSALTVANEIVAPRD
jgi:phytoene dehydrogenase-like protein